MTEEWLKFTAPTTEMAHVNSTILSLDNDASTIAARKPAVKAEPWLIYLSYVAVPLLLVVGLAGNSLTIVITRSRLYRHSSHGVYLTAMAVSDIIFLLAFPFTKRFTHELFGTDVRAFSVVGCKLFFFFFRASRSISASLIILICVERFIAVWFPLKIKYLSTKRAAITAVSCVFVSISAFSAIWTMTANIKNNKKCVPVVLDDVNKHVAEVCQAIGMSIRTCIPTFMLLLLTPLTVLKLYQQRTLRRQMSIPNIAAQDDTYKITLMLISVNVAFYILITPFCIAKHVFLFAGIDIVTAPLPWARNLHEVSQLCEQTNCVINFLLYVMLSTSFRKNCIAIFVRQREVDKMAISVDTVSSKFNSLSKI